MQGLDALRANQPQLALNDFQNALGADPNNGTAYLLASTAAVELYQGSLAVQYAEKAQQLNPQDWKIHISLVAAYAEAGDEAQRDQERALLRQMHQNGPREARERSGFLLEMFPVGPWHIEAVEYFEPMGKFHIYYRFLVRQADGKRVGEIDVQSDDFDERSWEQAHGAEAATGGRQFQLTGYGMGGQETDYRTFSGKPDYDAIREMAVFFLGKQGLPGMK
jgi:tetratricopeptide (TPR) repeat protein